MALISTVYLGSRDLDIGIDTINYYYSFNQFSNYTTFTVRKDFLFDLLLYLFGKFGDFQSLLYLCSFIYIFSAYQAFRILFKEHLVVPFLFFISFPFFLQFGVNVMRSGMSGSVFLLGIAYYIKGKDMKMYLCLIGAVTLHLSMIFPAIVFIINKRIKLPLGWILFLILMIFAISLLGFNPFISVLSKVSRFSSYFVSTNERQGDLFLYVLIPLLFLTYVFYILNVKNLKYTIIVNTYLLLLIGYIALIDIEFALRVNYLSGCLLPLIYFCPFNDESICLKKNFMGLKVVSLLFVLFLAKSIKFIL